MLANGNMILGWKIRYEDVLFLKKGFQFYPPCLAQILMLNDLGVELEVYHGKNSDFINQLLDKRKIKHHELFSDSLKNGKLQSVKKILNYRYEAKKSLKVSQTRRFFGLEIVNL